VACKRTRRSWQRKLSDLARQPHASCLQQQISSVWRVPSEVTSSTVDSVDVAPAATMVPESSAVIHCTVVVVAAAFPRVVVSVVRGEHHSVVIAECITADVARVAKRLKRVVARLSEYSESAVLGPVPAEVAAQLQLKSQFVGTAQCQLTEPVVANPVVASRIVKPDFKLRPRTIEEVGSVDVLLDQHRNAVSCATYHYIGYIALIACWIMSAVLFHW